MPDVTDDRLRNPAGRLLLILLQVRNQQPKLDSLTAWKNVFNLSEPRPFDIMKELSRLILIANDVEIWVRRLGLEEVLFVDSWRDPLNKACREFHLAGGFGGFRNNIDDTCITSLTFVSRELNRHCVEPEIQLKNLEEIANGLTELLDKVLASTSLDESLRKYLVEHLDLLLQAVQEYRYFGFAPIQNAVKAAVGSIVTDGQFEKSRETDEGKEFWSWMSKISSLLAIWQAGSKLLEKGGDIFGKILPPN